MAVENHLYDQPVVKSFFRYLIPSLIGMGLLSVNIMIDGIFVGHGVGSVALASVNIATPMYSVILSIGLLIGVGGGAIYSMALGSGDKEQAQHVFTISIGIVTVVTIIVSGICYLFLENIALFFGANEDTLAYVIDYMKILLIFSLFMVWETTLSVFIRNDGNPNLAMIGLIVTSLLNIVLNYWMIFILGLEVKGAALATVLSIVIGLLVLSSHFFKKSSQLKFVTVEFKWKEVKQINAIGFPSFLSEVGVGVFIIGYNIVIGYYAGTTGLAAFSVINYLHFFMFLVFIGVGSAIQPMISYYYGANLFDRMRETVQLAEKTAIILGTLFFVGGFWGASYLVSLFGITSEVISELAIKGIRLFFISYLFMGINFIYITYFQSIGSVKPALWITIFRNFIIFAILLLSLPFFFGLTGVWLVLPVTEALIACLIVIFARKGVMRAHTLEVNHNL
ncbi:MATE family efflux transporter [Pseudogracilibacillus auburnensis]|uniref:Multidrug export protein MepA n=1 Tax=Pseudogracilibacillus auburnensis TaxID=1494959 RepID=A0A2V3WNU6_9BACI|nr:MATE family efflux transporter [Pseudogracilibacillus auburnensis]PXW90379.1 putative MATE family efflux protein [Pseudogracilibacillus auburnensis]